jgi:SAM-dependent methyltransferase
VTGVDVSRAMIDIAMRRARPISIVEADFWSALPFEDAAFDAVVALHGTLAHPPEEAAYARLFAELARVLAPGGVFAAEVPAQAWLDKVAVGATVEHEGRRVRRTGESTFVYEDLVVGVSISALVPSDARWADFAGDAFDVQVAPIEADERLVIARRRLVSTPS